MNAENVEPAVPLTPTVTDREPKLAAAARTPRVNPHPAARLKMPKPPRATPEGIAQSAIWGRSRRSPTVSIWNAYAVGKAWVEARAAGGWPRLLCWSGAVMSASGFTWCYLIFLVLTAYHFQVIDATQLAVSLDLGYVLLVPGILLSGLMITLDSWARAFRQGGFLNYGVAVYNTYAQLHNAYSAITHFGDAFRSVRSFFGGGGRDRGRKSGWVVIVLLVGFALAAGVLTTTFIIWRAAGTTPLPARPTPEQFVDRARNIERVRR